MRRHLLPALAAGAALSVLPPTARAYRSGPPAAHTGGFGEATCIACHWGETEAPGDGLVIRAPALYQAGRTYEVGIELRDPALAAAGFQLAARFADGPGAGRQAGRLTPADSTVAVVTSGAGVQYASHSPAGTGPAGDGVARWTVRWTAPTEGAPVVFHGVGNAANDDFSEYGDRIHVGVSRVAPAAKR